MRVLMTALSPVGGIKTFFAYIYAHQSFGDCEIKLLSPSTKLAGYLAERVPKGRFSVVPTAGGSRGLYAAVRRALHAERFDLIHSHGFTAGAVTELARLGNRTPHLMTAHDVFLPGTFRGWRGRLRWLAATKAYRRLNGIHAVTQDGAANMREYFPGIRPERIHPITHGIDTKRFAGADAIDAHKALDLPPQPALIGFFGRFMAQKGFRTLVDAVELIVGEGRGPRDFRVVTFGWGGFIREDYAYLKAKGLEAYFIQHPATDEPERWIKSMDVIAMPSRWEACGLLAMEALCAGVPIVGTNCIGLREVLNGSPATVIDVGDTRALADGLLKEFELGRRGVFERYQPSAGERFAIDRPARALRDLYGDLAGEHASSGATSP